MSVSVKEICERTEDRRRETGDIKTKREYPTTKPCIDCGEKLRWYSITMFTKDDKAIYPLCIVCYNKRVKGKETEDRRPEMGI